MFSSVLNDLVNNHAGYLEVRMPKLNFVPEPKRELQVEVRPRAERLEVLSEREKEEMDFSKICQNFDLPPELEPLE